MGPVARLEEHGASVLRDPHPPGEGRRRADQVARRHIIAGITHGDIVGQILITIRIEPDRPGRSVPDNGIRGLGSREIAEGGTSNRRKSIVLPCHKDRGRGVDFGDLRHAPPAFVREKDPGDLGARLPRSIQRAGECGMRERKTV